MIDLPATPGPVELTWRQVDYGGRLTPPLGGEVQRINRLGNRLMLAVTLPPMTPDQARVWIAALNLGLSEGVRWRIRQVEFTIGAPGQPVVDGSGAAGAALPITGCTPGYAFRISQIVTLDTAAGRTTHLTAAGGIADGDGGLTLALVPPLRLAPADGDEVLVAGPTIEGLLDGDGFEWTIGRARRVGLSFTIMEQR